MKNIKWVALVLTVLAVGPPAQAQSPPPGVTLSPGGQPITVPSSQVVSPYGRRGSEPESVPSRRASRDARNDNRADGESDLPAPLPVTARPANADDYPAITRAAPARPSLEQLQKAWQNPRPAPGQSSPGRIDFDYDGKVMVLRARTYMLTTVTLPVCEAVEDIYVGDARTFRVAQERDNVFTIYPRLPGVDTNIHVVTASGTPYDFYVRAEGLEARDISDLTANIYGTGCAPTRDPEIRTRGFSGGSEEAIPKQPGALSQPSAAFDIASLNFSDYAILIGADRDNAIRPARVFHDAKFIYLDFGTRPVRRPEVYLTEDDIDMPVNTRQAGANGQIIVVEISPGPGVNLALKSGDAIVCIKWRGELAGHDRRDPGQRAERLR